MRKSFNNFGLIIEDDIFFGVSLGYDFTAEHEWGIKGMSMDLGIPNLTRKTIGIKSRTITIKKAADILVYGVDHDYAFLFLQKYGHNNNRYSLETKTTKQIDLPHDLENYKQDIDLNSREKDSIITAWSSEDFGIVVKGTQESKWLHELYQAFLKCNVSITYIDSKNPFANDSLCVLITDRIPENTLELMKKADKKHLDLKDIEKKLNLHERLRKSGKFIEYSLHACSPRFIDYEATKKDLKIQMKKHNTKHKVLFWVNSAEYYGLNTVEELEELLKDKNLTIEEFKKRRENN